MLHYEARTDTWYLDGHAVDPYEDFAAIQSASQERAEGREPSGDLADAPSPDHDADAELHRAIIREAIARVWSQDDADHLIHTRLVLGGH